MEAFDEVAFTNILQNFIKTADRAEKELAKLKENLIAQVSLTPDDIDIEVSTYRTLSKNGKMRV
jgi:SepF-like predicted cell division protein (DUF552 family)